ncbi:MAG TPA: C45 family peptidase [Noviherbaspirillum sp.]|nr:C45 family peptidase [Noviherbaspirillum sp.]
METLPFTRIEGSPSEIGEALGRLAKPALQTYLANSEVWKALQQWRGHARVDKMMAATRMTLPDCWEELEGMARAAGMPVSDIFLWNCRTDLLEETPDSSLSIAVNRLANGLIGHIVTGSRTWGGHCHIVDIAPRGKPGFIGFYCPGTLPGYAIAVSRAGLVQAMDTLPVHGNRNDNGLPSFALCRAMLDTTSMPDAIETLVENPRAGSFHQIVGWAGEFIMVSVEATPHSRSLVPIARTYGHANQALHDASLPQSPVDSVRERKTRISGLLAALPDLPDESDLFNLLFKDETQTWRHIPDARADEETTLATAVIRFTPTEIRLQISASDRASIQKHTILLGRR